MEKKEIINILECELIKQGYISIELPYEKAFDKVAERIVKLLTVQDVSDTVCSCQYAIKKKNYDKCAICGGKWTGRKQPEH